MRYQIITLLAATTAVTTAQAAFTALGTSAADSMNYGTFSGAELQSVTLNGKTYSTSQLTHIELTAFKGASSGVLLQQDGGIVNPSSQQRLDFLETDWRGDTGIINPDVASDCVAANFTTPVKNIDGADMFIYEINPSNLSGGDPFQIRINGVQKDVLTGNYGKSGAVTSSADVLDLGSTPADLTALLTKTANLGSSAIDQSIVGVAIDFSDFGVALGETVTSFSFSSSGSSSFDPVIIAAVPEPRTYAMLAGLLALSWVALRRRR